MGRRSFVFFITLAIVFCFMYSSYVFSQDESQQVSEAIDISNQAVSASETSSPKQPASPAMDYGVSEAAAESTTLPAVSNAEEPSVAPSDVLVTPAPALKEDAPAKDAGAAKETLKAEEKTNDWMWGEVLSVDQTNKQFVVKHMNYDTYEEVKTTLSLDDKAIFENVSGFADIKAGDKVTIDYRIKAGSNTAELIVVEKEATPVKEETEPAVKEEKPSQENIPVENRPETAPQKESMGEPMHTHTGDMGAGAPPSGASQAIAPDNEIAVKAE